MLERNGVIHPSSIWKKARFGEDSIIANFDTGLINEAFVLLQKSLYEILHFFGNKVDNEIDKFSWV